MKAKNFSLTRYDADDGKVFDWANLEEHKTTDENGNEVAYVSNNKLFINQVEVLVSYKISGFVDTVREDKSVVTKWVEGV